MGIVTNWIESPRARKLLQEARAHLEDLTPLKTNCGKLCGCACCANDETGDNGMLLFPFENKFYQKPIEGFPFRLLPDNTLYKGGYRLVCEGVCPREQRPLGCRLFPLRICLQSDDSGFQTHAVAEIDPRAYAVCPLPEMGGLRAMDPVFVEAVQKAGELLLKDVYMLEALGNEQKLLEEMCRL